MTNYKVTMQDGTIIHVQSKDVELAIRGAYRKVEQSGRTCCAMSSWVKDVICVKVEGVIE